MKNEAQAQQESMGGLELDRERTLRQARQELNNIRDQYYQDDEDEEECIDEDDLEAYE